MLTRWRDWIVCGSILLNTGSVLAYAYQGFYPQALYWLCALGLNLSLVWMK